MSGVGERRYGAARAEGVGWGVAWRGALGHVILGRQAEREDEELEEEDVREVEDELDGHRVASVVDYAQGPA